MSRRHRFKFKALLVGFVLVKIGITVFYLTGAYQLIDLFVPTQVAVAQEDRQPKRQFADKESRTAAEPQPRQRYAEVQALMDQLEGKRKALAEEERRIKKERTQLQLLKHDMEENLEQLFAVQKKIDEELTRKAEMEARAAQKKDAAETAKIKQLVKVYSSMKPKSAAAIIDKMDMKVVHQVFSNMKGEQVGKILSYVNQDLAAQITERLAAKSGK